jgi:hypothetical protein
VVHGDDDRFPRVPVDDAFQTDLFSSHDNSSRPIRFQDLTDGLLIKSEKAIAESCASGDGNGVFTRRHQRTCGEKRHLPLSDTVSQGREAFTTHC